MVAPLIIRVPRLLRPLIKDLLDDVSRTGRPIPLGSYDRALDRLYPDLARSAPLLRQKRRPPVPTLRIPLYGTYPSSTQHVGIAVPATQLFRFTNEQQLPAYLPTIRIGPARATRAYLRLSTQLPPLEMVARLARNPLGEASRRRKDRKPDYGYRRILAGINRTFGRYQEYLEFLETVNANLNDPLAMFTGLALNQAVDYTYGKRADLLKKHIYSKPQYRLPIGLDALGTLTGIR